MAANPVARITAMLSDESADRRIAAAIVLGELRAGTRAVIDGLCGMLADGGPSQQRHALEALARVGAAKAVDAVLPLTASRDPAVRAAAVQALVSVGDSVIPRARARVDEAGPDERKALDQVLARLGGKQAFGALLAGLDGATEEEAAAAAVAMRAEARAADTKNRKSYLTQIERFLVAQSEREPSNPSAIKAALKMLGYLEDERATPTLLAYARSKKHPPAVRQEALIALRFTSRKPDAKIVDALVRAAEDPDRTLAQTALITLGAMDLTDKVVTRLSALVAHPDVERAAFVLDMLGHRQGAGAAKVLVTVLGHHELRRAELAARALEGRTDAVPALAEALTAESDPERGKLLRNVLRPMAAELRAAQRDALLEAAVSRLGAGERGWESALDVAREASPEATGAALRALAARLRKGKRADKEETVLRMLVRMGHASDDERYRLASLALGRSRKDTRPAARHGDEALTLLAALARHGYDVGKALRADRSVDLEAIYYVGFHFVEEEQPLGEELLEEVVRKGGRKKIAKMAKNKLDLASRDG